MRIDVVHLVGRYPGLLHRILHCVFCAQSFRVGGGEVVGVGAHAAAAYFGVYLRAACLGVFVLFQNETAGAFAYDEAVAVGVVGARCRGRVVIACGERLHGVETTHAGLIDRRFRTAGYHDVGTSHAYLVGRQDDGMVGRRAGRNRTEVGTHKPVFHGDVSGRYVGYHLRDEEGAETRYLSAFQKTRYLVKHGPETADARSPNHSGTQFVHLLEVDARIGHRLVGGYHGVLREKVVFTYLLAVEEILPVVSLHFTGKSRLEFFGIEMRNGRSAADARLQVGEVFLYVVAKRINRADTGHNNSPFLHSEIFYWLMAEPAAEAPVPPRRVFASPPLRT